MDSRRIYEIFAEAIRDEKIAGEITELIKNKLDSGHIDGQTELFPNKDSVELSAENAALTRKIALLELETSRIGGENANLKAEMIRLKETLNSYCTAFAMQISLYEKYKTLSPDTMRVMKGIFKNDSMAGFFFCGVLPDNLKSLRDYTEQLAINSYAEKKDDIGVLCELYAYLLAAYNSTFSKPVYNLTEVRPGDTFDSFIHHNVGTEKSGKVQKVLLQGCVAAANGRVIRKAVIIL